MKSNILFESARLNALQRLQRILRSPSFKNARFVTLLDTHTYEYCFSKLISAIEPLQESHWIEIESSEKNKSIQTANEIWRAFLELEANKDTVLINLGGGVVSDIGGFVAGTYKRGIRYINIPTTLLSMVDAAIGGKTAVNILDIKNQVGLFYLPEYVCIFPDFLQTLPEKELKSGLGEMIKTALIGDADLWNRIKIMNFETIVAKKDFIYRCAGIKEQITKKDPIEKGLRKSLNFGHSIGHAIESLSIAKGKNPFSHGEAVALGMLCELFLSVKKLKFPEKEFKEIENFIVRNFQKVKYADSQKQMILDYLQHDKKNSRSKLKMSLLYEIGKPALDIVISEEDVLESLGYLEGL